MKKSPSNVILNLSASQKCVIQKLGLEPNSDFVMGIAASKVSH